MRFFRPPFSLVEPVGNEAATIFDADGKSVAMMLWPEHAPEDAELAEQETYKVGRLLAAAFELQEALRDAGNLLLAEKYDAADDCFAVLDIVGEWEPSTGNDPRAYARKVEIERLDRASAAAARQGRDAKRLGAEPGRAARSEAEGDAQNHPSIKGGIGRGG